FRITNIQSADGSTCALGVAMTWPDIKKVAHIHPDYSYGRNCFDHFSIVTKKVLPKAENVSEAWPKLFSTDFTPHITKTLGAKPDLLVTSLWGGDYVAFYKQALQHGLFNKMKVATTLALGSAPQSIGKDHPDGVLSGVHSNYHLPIRAGIAGRSTRRSSKSTTPSSTRTRSPASASRCRSTRSPSSIRRGSSPSPSGTSPRPRGGRRVSRPRRIPGSIRPGRR